MDTQQILMGTQEALSARRVFGEPVHVGDTTIIPAAVVSGGGGGGAMSQERGGAGFGMSVRPAGAYVVRNGDVTWRPAVDVNRIVLGGQIVAVAALFTLRALLLYWLARRSAASAERVPA